MKVYTLTISIITIFLTSCISSPQNLDTSDSKPKLTDDSSPQRPAWVDVEFEEDDDYLFFNGVSVLHATEQSARRSALNDATVNAMRHLETEGALKIERAIRSSGLETATIDGTNIGDTNLALFAQGSIRRQKSLMWYKEREADAYGKLGYVVHVRTSVPKIEIEKAHDEVIEQSIDEARKKQREAMTDEARQQWERTEELWRSYRKQNENFYQ